MPAMVPSKSPQQAAKELAALRKSLASWLKYRNMADGAPERPGKPVAPRDFAAEAELAEKLYDLLMQVVPESKLPDPQAKGAAVVLAQMALSKSPQATGAVPVWLIGVGIGAIALVAVTNSIADTVVEKERLRCVQAGACSDTSALWKWAALAGAGYLAYRHFSKKKSSEESPVRDTVETE